MIKLRFSVHITPCAGLLAHRCIQQTKMRNVLELAPTRRLKKTRKALKQERVLKKYEECLQKIVANVDKFVYCHQVKLVSARRL